MEVPQAQRPLHHAGRSPEELPLPPPRVQALVAEPSTPRTWKLLVSYELSVLSWNPQHVLEAEFDSANMEHLSVSIYLVTEGGETVGEEVPPFRASGNDSPLMAMNDMAAVRRWLAEAGPTIEPDLIDKFMSKVEEAAAKLQEFLTLGGADVTWKSV